MQAWLDQLLSALALPEFGLSTVFVVSFVSATLLPLGSEPAVFGLIKLSPHLFWPTIGVATLGNTLGGMTSWWMGRAAHGAVDHFRDASLTPTERARAHTPGQSATHLRALQWLERLGPKACVLSFLPIIGDPLCAVAGWLRLPALPCAAYMALGKFARYVVMTAALLWVWPGQL